MSNLTPSKLKNALYSNHSHRGKSSRKYKQKAKECKMPKKKKKYEQFERKKDIMSAIEVPQEDTKKQEEPTVIMLEETSQA